MSGFELNKITAAILLASLIAMIVGVIAHAIYKPKLDIAQRGYKIEVTEGGPAQDNSKPEEPVDIKKLMTSANAAEGEKIVKKCTTCHALEQGGANKIGPHLWKIHGAPKGKVEGFTYSKALASAGGVWDDESLYHFINKPSKFIPGTKMTFAGLSKPEDIANVIAFLKAE